jgi:D-alanine transaminase
MSRIAYVNGAYVPLRRATVNVEDRGYQFGDGVYEVVHCHAGRLIDEALHLDRLDRSLGEIRLAAPMGRTALQLVLREVVVRNRLRDGLVYVQVTRGVARREHPFPKQPIPPALVVTARPIPPMPSDIDRWATAAITMPDLRWARCDIKSLNLLPNVLARQAAREQGAFEAILVDGAGMVTEGAATTVWVVNRDGVLCTRALDHAVLPGCTRAALIALLNETKIDFEERGVSADELRLAREAFLTSATSYVRPLLSIDGRSIGDGAVGPLTRRLFALFARHVAGPPANAN